MSLLNKTQNRPIGIFDSGYGGLTVFKEIKRQLPEYDFIYLGDNARAPYGTRSFETVYKYTLQCVKWFFENNCPLVILACNTASAKALRTIQQKDLINITSDENRVLGVIRPTSETIGKYTTSRHIGLVATNGTVASDSYPIEVKKYWPDVKLYQQSCPMWVPLIENNVYKTEGALYFIKKDLEKLFEQSKDIDTILLACTHYPVLVEILKELVPANVKITSQDSIVAESLKYYLKRHTKLDARISKTKRSKFFTTGSTIDFDQNAHLFYGEQVESIHVELG